MRMHASGRIQLVFLAGIWITGLASQAFCQGTLVRQTPQSATTDSSGHLKKGDAASANDTTAHGLVVLADGSAPMELVEIYGGCGGIQKLIAIADSKGRISFNPSVLTGDAIKAKACTVHASLDGYLSETKAVTDTNLKSGGKLGKIVLQPLSSSVDGLISRADGEANKAQRTMYEKALDEAAKQDWANAIASLEKATSAYPGYSSAWLSLGILQQSRRDRAGAEKSFLEAARVDPRFALPLIQAAALEALQGDWQATLAHSQKAIDINPAAFPQAYSLNALANISLQNADAAEKSAREGLRLDTEHQYLELEYALGIVLYSKNDNEGAAKHLQAYVDESPEGSNAAAARNELAQMQAGASVRRESTASLQDRVARRAWLVRQLGRDQ